METKRLMSLSLSPLREKAASMMAEGNSQSQVARELHISKGTICKWYKKPEFKGRVDQLRVDLKHQAEEVLEMGITDAAKTVTDLASGRLDFADAKELNPRLRAALYILDRFTKKGKGAVMDKRPSMMPAQRDEYDEIIEQAEIG